MTPSPNEIRLAIAKAEGWIAHRCMSNGYPSTFTSFKNEVTGYVKEFDELPNYCNSIDVTRAAVEKQDLIFKYAFHGRFVKILDGYRCCFIHELTALDWATCFYETLKQLGRL